MSYRVIQWSTGHLGRDAVAGIAGHPALELVGAWVHTPEKDGRDVGELCGLRPLGVVATGDKAALLAMPADCVCYTARSWMADPRDAVRELCAILRAGKNVVNSAWPALVHPQAAGVDIYEQLQDACLAGGATLYTGGVDPGVGNYGLALTGLSMTREVRSVRMYEILNYTNFDHPEMVTHYGFGQPDIERVFIFTPGHTTAIWAPTMTVVADAVGVTFDEIVEDHRVIYADEAFDIGTALHIPKGAICGMRFEIKGMAGGVARVVCEHVTRLRDQDFPEVVFPGGGYRVEIEGDPHIRLDMALSSDHGDAVHAAYIAGAMTLVNAIPRVCEAPPGVLLYPDMRPYTTTSVV